MPRVIRMLPRASAPTYVPPALPAAPEPPPVPPPVQVDMSALLECMERQEALLVQILAATQQKKRWNFIIVKDAMGRPASIEAEQL